ncbi:MAG: hypothetical protein QOG20_3017 [Pseudonocardiales bacterium]|nr:hypothetical protein [Pseudonocardiales bacterium]
MPNLFDPLQRRPLAAVLREACDVIARDLAASVRRSLARASQASQAEPAPSLRLVPLPRRCDDEPLPRRSDEELSPVEAGVRGAARA